jgi:5'-nucleotidase
MTNPGGIRTDLERRIDGDLDYAQVFAAQPFGNSLVTETLNGAQIKRVLEDQWAKHPERPLILQVSSGLRYTFDLRRPIGERVLSESLTLNGEPMRADQNYRVTINSFLAAGGDGFSVLAQGTELQVGPLDADALEQYIAAHSPLAPPLPGRIVRLP